jgi:hypothetical protein
VSDGLHQPSLTLPARTAVADPASVGDEHRMTLSPVKGRPAVPCAASANRLPLWLKTAYTAYVAVLVPVYLHYYGPTNFLYYCDVALLMTVAALWLECSLLASAALVGIFLVQMVWVADFLGILVGHPVVGMTSYMFDPEKWWFLRALSFFHFWLPFFLIGVVWRLGYDRRAFWAWAILAWILMPICYFLMPAPPAPADDPNLPVNIDYVYGFDDTKPVNPLGLDGNLYFALVMIALPVGILLPSHLLFCLLFRPPAAAAPPISQPVALAGLDGKVIAPETGIKSAPP